MSQILVNDKYFFKCFIKSTVFCFVAASIPLYQGEESICYCLHYVHRTKYMTVVSITHKWWKSRNSSNLPQVNWKSKNIDYVPCFAWQSMTAVTCWHSSHKHEQSRNRRESLKHVVCKMKFANLNTKPRHPL